MPDLPPHLPLVLAVFLLAGLIKGVIGLGLPTVAMGLLGLAMPPAQAAALLVVPSLVTNVWQLLAGPRFGVLARRLWPMLLCVCGGTWAAADILTGGAGGRVTSALGMALVLYALTGLLRVRLRVPARAERWAGPLVGGATGLVTGATGVFVLPAVPYLGALGLARDDLVQALGLSFTVSTIALAAGLATDGALPLHAAATSSVATVPALAGMALGGWLRGRVRPEMFRVLFFAGLLVLGGELLLRGLA